MDDLEELVKQLHAHKTTPEGLREAIKKAYDEGRPYRGGRAECNCNLVNPFVLDLLWNVSHNEHVEPEDVLVCENFLAELAFDCNYARFPISRGPGHDFENPWKPIRKSNFIEAIRRMQET